MEKDTIPLPTRQRNNSVDYEEVEEARHEIKTTNSGIINVFVQGSTRLEALHQTTAVFLTVHDIGSNHTEFHKIVDHASMFKIKQRSVWIHVELPGQGFDAPDLPEGFVFPTMQEISDDLLQVVDHFNVKICIGIGVGAGSNILARFGMSHPEKLLGLILINCHSTVASLYEHLNDKIISWKLNALGMSSNAWKYMVLHKFGTWLKEEDKEREILTKDYVDKLEMRMNPKNLRLYVEAYMNRTDLSAMLKERMTITSLLISGSMSSHVEAMEEMLANMNPRTTTMLKIDDCGDVFADSPDSFSYNLLLFSQGLGLFSILPMSRSGSLSNPPASGDN